MNENFKINNIDKWKEKLGGEDSLDYVSPITLFMEEMETKIENDALVAVQRYGFDVDAQELAKALAYDRDQYSKGYAAARKEFEPRWIPITFRPFTEEELRDYCEKWSVKPEDVTDREGGVHNCPMPDDGEEVLITTTWGNICLDTFHADPDGFFFEDHDDADDVAAWMRLPKPYETKGGQEGGLS